MVNNNNGITNNLKSDSEKNNINHEMNQKLETINRTKKCALLLPFPRIYHDQPRLQIPKNNIIETLGRKLSILIPDFSEPYTDLTGTSITDSEVPEKHNAHQFG